LEEVAGLVQVQDDKSEIHFWNTDLPLHQLPLLGDHPLFLSSSRAGKVLSLFLRGLKEFHIIFFSPSTFASVFEMAMKRATCRLCSTPLSYAGQWDEHSIRTCTRRRPSCSLQL